jgi:hypothetical protein
VISDVPAVWQLQSPNTRIVDDAVDVTSLAKQDGWSNCRSITLTHGRRLTRDAHSLTLTSG